MQISALFQELSNKEATLAEQRVKFKKKRTQKISDLSMVDRRE